MFIYRHRFQRTKTTVFLCTATYKSGPCKGDRCFASTQFRFTARRLYDECDEALCPRHLAAEKTKKKTKGKRS